MIQIDAISKDFEAGETTLRVLDRVSTTLRPGELTMLVGPSGCGKTTLLSILSGILTPTEGQVLVNGTNLTALRGRANAEFRRRHIGFVFQQFNLLPSLTAAENAAIPLVAAGVSLAEGVERARAVLAQVDLAAHADKLPRQLSGGQQQRVAFARALVHGPKLIVCDEPTSALDAQSGHQVMDILRANAVRPDTTVVVVTHDSRIFTFADRILSMSDGRLVNDTRGGSHVPQTA